jgi:hypothetical protein
MFVLLLFFISSVFTGCTKKNPEPSPRQFYYEDASLTTPDTSYTNDDARRDTFEDFGEPIDYPDEESPKIKDYYRVYYYHFI